MEAVPKLHGAVAALLAAAVAAGGRALAAQVSARRICQLLQVRSLLPTCIMRLSAETYIKRFVCRECDLHAYECVHLGRASACACEQPLNSLSIQSSSPWFHACATACKPALSGMG